MGLGLHGGGIGTTKFFVEQGAKVLVTDLKSKKELKESLERLKGLPIRYILNQHREEDFINTDLVIKNPAVPINSKYLAIAKENKVPIETDVGIFFELCPRPIIGVTGTKGKSTTVSLITHFLREQYQNVILAGNIGESVLEKLNKIKKDSLVILELSSWQLAGLKQHRKSPHLAVITNIMPDHLDRYKSMTEYIEDKKLIFKFQQPDDYLILNQDDSIVRNFAKETKSKVYFFKGKTPFESNVSAAQAVAKLYKIPFQLIKKSLKEFKGLPGRLELVAEIDGIKYINDTYATNPAATLAALNNLPSGKIILIAGGADKNLDFNSLAQTIIKKVKAVILLEGTATDKLEKLIKSRVSRCDNMSKAVKLAREQAQKGDIILLSPASASFGLFRQAGERGEYFNKAVALLK